MTKVEKRIEELYVAVAKADYSDLGYSVKSGKSGKGAKINIVPAAVDKVHPNFLIKKEMDNESGRLTLKAEISHRSATWCPFIELIFYVDGEDYHNYTDAGDLVIKELKRYMAIESDELFKHIRNTDKISVMRDKVALTHGCATFNIFIC